MSNVMFGEVLQKLALFRRVPGAMQHSCIFCTSRRIAWMSCIISLALTSTDLLGVRRQGGSSSLLLPAKNGSVGFCLLNIFRRCSSFVYCFCDFHAFKHVACVLVGAPLEISSLYVGLFYPGVWDGVYQDLIEYFRYHLLGVARAYEKRNVVV